MNHKEGPCQRSALKLSKRRGMLTEKRDDQYFEKMIENAQNLYFDSASAFSNWVDASHKEIREGHSSAAALSIDL